MDHSVALVQAYLQINGYFTVVEYPVAEALRLGGYTAVTDLDVLAFRFGQAGHLIKSPHRKFDPSCDPALNSDGRPDMIIGEVKEGRAELNRGASQPSVLRAALARFGCCDLAETGLTVSALLRDGVASTPSGHRVRLFAFGSTPPRDQGHFTYLSHEHVLTFLQNYIRENWDIVGTQQYKDPAMGMLVLQEKIHRARQRTEK